jgi:hypothetical protein
MRKTNVNESQRNFQSFSQAATESIQQLARDIKGMRTGILPVIHNFSAEMEWHA